VSEFDLLKALMEGRDLEMVRAEEIMTQKVTVAQEDTPVDAIIRLLETEHLIRVPVIRDGRLVGIVARRDILFGYIKSTATYWP
jgi:CBS domain-containing protein